MLLHRTRSLSDADIRRSGTQSRGLGHQTLRRVIPRNYTEPSSSLFPPCVWATLDRAYFPCPSTNHAGDARSAIARRDQILPREPLKKTAAVILSYRVGGLVA